MVFCGLVIACLLAGSPTLRSPFFKNATTEGVVRLPSSLAITTGSLPSITATQLLVVPKSIPIIFPISFIFFKVKFYALILNHYAMGRQDEKLAETFGQQTDHFLPWSCTTQDLIRPKLRHPSEVLHILLLYSQSLLMESC